MRHYFWIIKFLQEKSEGQFMPVFETLKHTVNQPSGEVTLPLLTKVPMPADICPAPHEPCAEPHIVYIRLTSSSHTITREVCCHPCVMGSRLVGQGNMLPHCVSVLGTVFFSPFNLIWKMMSYFYLVCLMGVSLVFPVFWIPYHCLYYTEGG